MRFGFFATLALIPSALALPAVSATAAAAGNAAGLVSAFKKLQTDVVSLNKTLNTFKAGDVLGLFTALQIQQQTGALADDITAALKVANASSNFNSDQSTKIALVVLDFQPQIKSLLANIVSHKPAFASAFLLVGDLSKTVEKALRQQRRLTKQLGTVIAAKLAPPFGSLAPTITAQIDMYFAQAIKQFVACTGLLCLPAIG